MTDTEELRQKLLTEAYAMAFTGTPAVLLDEDKIKRADAEELVEIAKQCGIYTDE